MDGRRARLTEELRLASLREDDLREIEESAAKITARGDRYPAHLQQRVGRLGDAVCQRSLK